MRVTKLFTSQTAQQRCENAIAPLQGELKGRMWYVCPRCAIENPSPKDVDDYSDALSKAGVEHVFHRYDGAGHAFQSFNNQDCYRYKYSEDAWDKVLSFFAEKLR